MSKRWQLFWIIMVWSVVGAISVTIRMGGVLNLADFWPGAPVILAMEDGRLTGTEWLDVLFAWVVVVVIFWRMMRRSKRPDSSDTS